jgi:protein AroM
MRKILGLVTIGQTPRRDLEILFKRHIPESEILMLGALDGLTGDEIIDLANPEGEYPLHARLADGTSADIPLENLVPLVTCRVKRLASSGAEAVVVLCAGGFPGFDSPVPVLLPGRVVPAAAGAISRDRRVGVVTPIPGQERAARKKWEDDGFSVRVVSASPSHPEELDRAAAELSNPAPELVVLDCMGYGEECQRKFAERCRRPVLLAQTLVARVAGAVLQGCTSSGS